MTRFRNTVITWRSHVVDSDLSSRARLTALVLSLHMNERGESCFPRLTTLAGETGLGKRTVERALVDLRDAGYLRIVERTRDTGATTSNEYFAVLPDPTETAETCPRHHDDPPV